MFEPLGVTVGRQYPVQHAGARVAATAGWDITGFVRARPTKLGCRPSSPRVDSSRFAVLGIDNSHGLVSAVA
jgi:hypothetical protein